MLIKLKQEVLLPPLIQSQILYSRIDGIDLLCITLSLFLNLIMEEILSKNNVFTLSAGDFL